MRAAEILPRLWSSHDRGIAGGMYTQDMIYVATARALRTGAMSREHTQRLSYRN
jgi:hypothetical protein